MVKAKAETEVKKAEPMLSAIQVKKGLSKKHETFLAALVEIKEGKQVEVPDSVAGVLDEFSLFYLRLMFGLTK